MVIAVAEAPPEKQIPVSNIINMDDTGFPFEDPTEEDVFGRSGLRSHFDSLASRHPQFASQLRGGPWGSSAASAAAGPGGGGWARKRRGSGSLPEDDGRSASSGGSGGTEYRGFPFDDFPSDFRQHIPPEFGFRDFPAYTTIPRKPRSRNTAPAQAPAPSQTPPQPSQPTANKVDFSTQTEEIPLAPSPATPSADEQRRHSRGALPQYGLRNTVDLGQAAAAADEQSRNQRSMSAPPDHRGPQQQRFVSRVNIDSPQTGMGQKATTQSTASGPSGPTVRNIPIFVEGRDEPVLNQEREIPVQHQTSQPVYKAAAPPFVPPQPFVPSQPFVPPHAAPTPTPPKPQTPPPAQQAHYLNDPIAKIQAIQKDVLDLMTQVENFTGSRKEKSYVLLDELLTRNLIKLDDVETEGKENIRLARKEAIRCIQKTIAVLEAKADALSTALVPVNNDAMEVEVMAAPPAEPAPVNLPSSVQTMEIEKAEVPPEPPVTSDPTVVSKVDSKSAIISPEAPAPIVLMDVESAPTDTPLITNAAEAQIVPPSSQ